MTETGCNVTFLGPAEHRAGASGDAAILAGAGRPHDGVEIRIAAAKDGAGEILVRGAQVAAGYWPGNTPAAVDGWFHTGDVGRLDDDGRLVVVDGRKDVIITGGENVSSRATCCSSRPCRSPPTARSPRRPCASTPGRRRRVSAWHCS